MKEAGLKKKGKALSESIQEGIHVFEQVYQWSRI
jgi:hypothetical protein